MAVGLFNLGEDEATVTARWEGLGLNGERSVRNLWQRRDEGIFDDSYSAVVSPHGAVMLKIAGA